MVFMVAEAAAGFLAGSLALLSDAGHMATDAIGLGMALAAIVTADRAGSGTTAGGDRALPSDRYGIAHATPQVGPDVHTGCEEVGW